MLRYSHVHKTLFITETSPASPVVPIVASISAVVAVAILAGLAYYYRRRSPSTVARVFGKLRLGNKNRSTNDDTRVIRLDVQEEEVTFDGRNQRYESPVFYEADVDSKSTTKIDNVAHVNSTL